MNATGSLRLHGVHVLGPTGEFDGPVDLLVEDGVVTELGAQVATTRSVRTLDGEGLWIVPGVFDCHVHAGLSSFDQLELMRTPYSRRVLETAAVLRRTLDAGVTFVRDAGIVDAGVRDAVADGVVAGPEMQVSVVAIGSTGGHEDGFLAGPGWESSVDYSLPDYPGRPRFLADGPDEMRKVVRQVLRSGADWIKLMATRGVLSGADGGFDPELTREEIAVAVEEARRRHRPVMVHALGGEAIRWAVEAGARSIEHGVFLTEEDAALMARHHCALVPTLAVYHRLVRLADEGRFNAARTERARSVGRQLGEAVAIAHAAGVRIAVGSDFGHRDDHGANLVELAHLNDAGLSVAETLLAATATGADLCGVGDRLGRIAVGFRFDAVVLGGEPRDLSALAAPDAITAVFQRGLIVRGQDRMAEWLI